VQYERRKVVGRVQTLKGAFRPHSKLHKIILSLMFNDAPTRNVVVKGFTPLQVVVGMNLATSKLA